jgi:Domain of unknown function (DUF4390)
MKSRWMIVGLVVAVCATGVLLRAAETLRIQPLIHEGQVFVSVEVTDLNTEEVREVIASGLRTTFTYDVEVRMVVPTWVDRTIATAVITTSDQYDNLTRQHRLSRTVDGRVEASLNTEDETVARRWLTTLSRVPLCETSKLDPNRDYYIRINARERPRGASIFGWAATITGQAKFTFIP